MLMEIPFTHETGGVFTESIGMPGLDHSSFGSLMPRAAKSIELLRQRKASGELPLLSLPARRDDINAWQPIIDRYRSQFDDVVVLGIGGRSEEHTSELQSLMRISYAVVCLKIKTYTTSNTIEYK